MRKFIPYFLLFSLVFLNVPRELVHDCEHDSESHEHSDSSGVEATFDVDNCFVCEFDLDLAHVPDFFIPRYSQDFSAVIIDLRHERYSSGQFDLYSSRGPPIV